MMNPKQTVSAAQMGFLLMIAAYGGIIYLHPEVIALSGRMAWIAEVFGGLVTMALTLGVIFLAKFYPGKTIFEILEDQTGKVISIVLGLPYLFILIITTALYLIQFTMVVKTYILVRSPMIFPIFLILLTVMIIASKGFEPLARTGFILMIAADIMFFAALTLGFIHLFDWSNIFPIFDKDFGSFINGSYLAFGLLSENTFLLMIMMAYLSKPAQGLKIMTLWFLLVILIISSVPFIFIGIFGFEEASRLLYVGINVAQAISFGRFLQGMEVFMLFAYSLLSILRIALYIHCGQVYCSQLFKIKKLSKIILASITVAVFFLSLMVSSINTANFYYILIAKYVIPPFVLTILTLAFLGLGIKRRKERKSIIP